MFGKEKSQYIEDSKFRYTMREMKKNSSAYVLALPYFLLFLFFTAIPVLISLPVGFTNFNMAQFPKWTGLSNFYTLFLADDVFRYTEYTGIRDHHGSRELYHVLHACVAH